MQAKHQERILSLLGNLLPEQSGPKSSEKHDDFTLPKPPGILTCFLGKGVQCTLFFCYGSRNGVFAAHCAHPSKEKGNDSFLVSED